ncbi:MAG: aspartate/glutamate racemase family protein [Candidatus Saccharimonadales bacterium]
MKIGVFDSGIGGRAVAQRLHELIPHAEIISIDDHAHMPYGNRTDDDIISLTKKAIQPLIDAECDSIVIACNTATTVAIKELRKAYPTMKFVGIEPMVKPASRLTKSKHIAVLATPATLASQRYKDLKMEWASGIDVREPDCHNWASLIENDRTQDVPIETVVKQLIGDGVDVIVLACTHYHLLKERALKAADGHAHVLEPSEAISKRIISLLTEY